jgi:hypothetical protein
MIKKQISKEEIRRDLEDQLQRFLQHGGQIEQVPQGQSARDAGEPADPAMNTLFLEPRAQRTLVPEVVAAIESRRRSMRERSPAPRRSARRSPRRKVIYDDFGEPLRRVWVDD